MGTTTKMAIPYPEATGLVKDGWEDMKDIATQVDAKSGLVLLNTTSFSAQSSVTVNSVFNSSFDNYTIVFANLNGSGGNADIQFRLRKSGTDNSSNIYWRQYILATSTSLSGARTQATAWAIGAVRDQGPMAITMDLFSPNLATSKTTSLVHYMYNSTTELIYVGNAYHHDLATSADYDGFTFYPSSGTMSGTVSVYGYNK